MTLNELKEALEADKEKAETFERALAGDECKACGSKAEAISLAAGAVGFEISPEELERATAEAQELDSEELKRVVAGGENESCWFDYQELEACVFDYFCGVFKWS
jgi:hypothetical protein